MCFCRVSICAACVSRVFFISATSTKPAVLATRTLRTCLLAQEVVGWAVCVENVCVDVPLDDAPAVSGHAQGVGPLALDALACEAVPGPRVEFEARLIGAISHTEQHRIVLKLVAYSHHGFAHACCIRAHSQGSRKIRDCCSAGSHRDRVQRASFSELSNCEGGESRCHGEAPRRGGAEPRRGRESTHCDC